MVRFGDQVRCFVSYPRARQDVCARFVEFVFDEPLREIATYWMDTDLHPGERWDTGIRQSLESAEIILVLLSPAFLASQYCVEVEGRLALERAAQKTAKVFAVLLEECDYAAHGFDALPLLSEDGKPLHGAAALVAAALDLKYAAYEAFEQKNRAIEYNETVEFLDCALVHAHWDSKGAATTPAGKRLWLSSGALLGAAIGYAVSRVLRVDGAFNVPLLLCAVGSCLGVAAALFRQMELRRKGLPRSSSSLLRGAILGMLSAVVPAAALAVVLFVAERLPRAPTLVAASSVIGLLFFLAKYGESRPQRLAVYRQLVRAHRVPRGGWLIDTLEAEYEEQRNALPPSPPPLPPLPPPPPIREQVPVRVAPEPEPQRDWEEFFRAYEEETRAREKRRGTLLDDEPRTGRRRSLSLFFHPSDDAARLAFEEVLREEGGDDLCDIRVCPIGEWRSAIDGAELVVALLSPHFVSSPEADELYAAIGEGVVVVPVQLERVDTSSRFSERQFVPADAPVSAWADTKTAYQHVARHLLGRTWLIDWVKGLPPLRRTAWDVEGVTAAQWIWVHGICSFAAAIVVWALAREWDFLRTAIAFTVVPVVVAAVQLYRETKKRNRADLSLTSERRFALVRAAFPLWLTAVAVAALVFPSLFAISIAATTDATPRALLTFADVGVAGGFLFACGAYFGTRRRRPVVLAKRKPPTQDDARRSFRQMGVFRGSPRAIARLAAETIVFTAPAVILFIRIGSGSGPELLQLAVAAWVALWVQGILLGLYGLLFDSIENRHEGIRTPWKHYLRQFVVSRVLTPVRYRPIWIWIVWMMVFAALAAPFSAPVAPPLLSAALVAAFIAGIERIAG